MDASELIGLLLLTAGAIAVPAGWMFGGKVLTAGVILISVGIVVYATSRVRRRLSRSPLGYKEGSRRGPDTAEDFHNYTGWQTGGRTDHSPFDSHSGGGDFGDD